MNNNDELVNKKVLMQQRVSEFLDKLASEGKNHRTIASLLGIPVQYLSDFKQGRRSVSAPMASRFEELFGVHALWLLAQSDVLEAPIPTKLTPSPGANAFQLPVFPHPIEGDPALHPKWDGTYADVVGVAAVKLSVAKQPYLLRFGADDELGRLAPGDLLLMSQAILPPIAAMESVIQVIRHGRGLYLARRRDDAWRRLATGHSAPITEACSVHGHVMGIVWGSTT